MAKKKSDDEISSDKMKFSVSEKTPIVSLSDFNPNELDKEGWISLGFTENQANIILNWKYPKIPYTFSINIISIINNSWFS
jgi:hypothetical protein